MDRLVKFWDMTADKYDEEEGTFDPTYQKTIDKTRQYLHGGEIVLDFGCATGTVAMEIADLVHEVQGIDVSSKMIAIAQQKAIERKIEKVAFAQASLFDEHYEKESFDVILALNVLHLLDNLESALQRIGELLKGGGLFISVTPCMAEKATLTGVSVFLLSKVGIVPSLRFLKIPELESSIDHGELHIIETERLKDRPTLYFIAARKS